MIPFLVRRFIGLLFVVFGIASITFIMGYFSPGDPIKEMMGDHFNQQLWLNLRHTYGLDLPWYQQYFNYLGRLARFDLGIAFQPQQRPVWEILKDGVPISLELTLWGSIITLFLGIPVGVWSALKANTWIDTFQTSVALILYSLPVFVIALSAQLLVLWVQHLAGTHWPVSGWGVPWHYSWSDLQYKLMPILAYVATGYAYYARLTRTCMLEILRQEYVRTARAKGLREQAVIYQHALRNAIIPLTTALGLLIGRLVAGSFFIESIFGIQGIAAITVSSVLSRNYPVIQATAMLIATGVVVGNLISDILYSLMDPRISSQ